MQDSDFIQDLLECSVCLEQLTDQSKVLPCQHTFCRKCLAEIMATQHELKCPECRIKVNVTSLDQLPSNIFLIRLLEGIKNNIRQKSKSKCDNDVQTASGSNVNSKSSQLMHTDDVQKHEFQFKNSSTSAPKQTSMFSLSTMDPSMNSIVIANQPININTNHYMNNNVNHHPHHNNNHNHINNVNLNNMPSLTHNPTIFQTLSVPSNGLLTGALTIGANMTSNAINGTNNGPTTSNTNGNGNTNSGASANHSNANNSNHNRIVSGNNLNGANAAILINNPVPIACSIQLPARARALFDYEGNEFTDLSFKRNDIITIRQQTDANWFIGEINGKQGFLPMSFVQIIEEMNTSAINQQNYVHMMRAIPMDHLNRPVSQANHILTDAQPNSIPITVPTPSHGQHKPHPHAHAHHHLLPSQTHQASQQSHVNYHYQHHQQQQQQQQHHLQQALQLPPNPSHNSSNQNEMEPKRQSKKTAIVTTTASVTGTHLNGKSINGGKTTLIENASASNVYGSSSLPVQVLTSPMCRALYDFRVADVADKSCLTFNKNDMILFIRKVDDNWAEGRIDHRVGIFPISFVQMLPPGSSLQAAVNLRTTAGTTDGSTVTGNQCSVHSNSNSNTNLNGNANHNNHTTGTGSGNNNEGCTSVHVLQSAMNSDTDEEQRIKSHKALHVRSNSLNVSSTMNRNKSNPLPYVNVRPSVGAGTTGLMTTASGTSGADHNSNVRLPVPNNANQHTINRKRHSMCLLPSPPPPPLPQKFNVTFDTVDVNNRTNQSFQSLEVLNDRSTTSGPGHTTGHSTGHSGSANSNSYDNLLSIRPNCNPQYYVALYNYKPQKSDELELRKNELYVVNEKCLDGWYKGSSFCGKRTGVFPGNYVQPVRNNVKASKAHSGQSDNRRSYGNLNNVKFESAENLLSGANNEPQAHSQLMFNMANNGGKGQTGNGKLVNTRSHPPVMCREMNGSSADEQVTDALDKLNLNKDLDGELEDTSGQWHKPKVTATLHIYGQLDLNKNDVHDEHVPMNTLPVNTLPVVHRCVDTNETPVKKDSNKKGNLIKFFGSRKSRQSDKTKGFFCDNPTFVDVSPKN